MLRDPASSMRPHAHASGAPIPIESHALGTLSYIRASMDSAGSLAVPGMAGIVIGAIGLMAAVLASIPALRGGWLGIWLVAACLAFALGGTLMLRQAGARRGHARYFGPARKFLLCLCPALIVGGILTFALWHAGNLQLIPATWLLLYGCAVIPASTATNPTNLRLIAAMGALFIGLGILALVLPFATQTVLLGAGFGFLHLCFGLLIRRANHGD